MPYKRGETSTHRALCASEDAGPLRGGMKVSQIGVVENESRLISVGNLNPLRHLLGAKP